MSKSNKEALIEDLTAEQIDHDVSEYLKILDDKATEHVLHDFLANHSYFFNGFLRMTGGCPLYSKIKLGSDHEVDFAWVDRNSFGPFWTLVEIESPKQKLLTKGGDPTAALTHARQQISDWHGWVHKNPGYAQKIMPGIDYPSCFLFMGRRDDLTEADRAKLKQYCQENKAHLSLRTLDSLADGARSLKGFNKMWSCVPKNAKSHAELAAGLPEDVTRFIHLHTSSKHSELMREHREDARARLSAFTEDI